MRADGLTRQFRNLTAIPSVHYDPTFGRIVHEVFARAAPAVVALELPPQFRAELAWASHCWPTPVASLAQRSGQTRRAGLLGIPFVPGDSIFETAIDVARTSLYARNLASTDRLSEDPAFGELIIAAEATIGPHYAGAIYTLATKTDTSAQSASLEPLTYEADSKRRVGRFRFRDVPICIEPWVPHRSTTWVAVPASAHIERTARDAQYEGLPGPEKGEKFHWGAYPPDQVAYEAFIRYALRRASQVDPSEARSVPFMTGLEDGLDVRTTIRFWHERRMYVRRRQRARLNVRNGVIDWRNASESSDLLRGKGPDAGWNDPDFTTVGSVSLEAAHETIHSWGQAAVTRRAREWSFITLDYPTFETRPGTGTLWDSVIRPLVDLGDGCNNIYRWLALVFRFSANKPFVYYSKYTPSPRILKIARAHNVVLQWCPLETLSAPLRERHGTWRQLWMTSSQWRALRKRLAVDPFYLPSASAGELRT